MIFHNRMACRSYIKTPVFRYYRTHPAVNARSLRKRTRRIGTGDFSSCLHKIRNVIVEFCADFKEQIAFQFQNTRSSLVQFVFKFLKARSSIAVAVYKSAAHNEIFRNRRELPLAYFYKIAERVCIFYAERRNPRPFTFLRLILRKNFIKIVVNVPPVIKFLRPAGSYKSAFRKGS